MFIDVEGLGVFPLYFPSSKFFMSLLVFGANVKPDNGSVWGKKSSKSESSDSEPSCDVTGNV